MELLLLACVALTGYLLGSVSFSLLLARRKGLNLREIGSGNLGATNASRALGPRAGIQVFLLDMLKGGLPTLFFAASSGLDSAIAAAAGAWLGHVFPLWHGFRGGKGVATLAGGFFILHPYAFLGAGFLFVGVRKRTKMMSAASIAFVLALVPLVWLLPTALNGPWILNWAIVAAVLTLWTHRSNLGRILRGQERKIGEEGL